jgi:hypothetical protein
VRTLTTPGKLAKFEDRTVNAARGVPPQPRDSLPEVIGPFDRCFDYELSYDATLSLYATFMKIKLLTEWDGYPGGDNVIQANLGTPRMLSDIISEVQQNVSAPIQLHWAACRAIDLG